MKLTLIRHTAVDVPEGVCYGFSDVPLKESFESEALIVKNNLKGLSFEKVYSSPLSRCTRLAEFCGYPDAFRDDRLKELNFGDWEMKPWMQISKGEAAAWFADWLNCPAQNGESYARMNLRVKNFMDELIGEGNETACIFTHSGVIRLIHVYAGICTLEESFDFQVDYGQVFNLEVVLA